jgi:dipeptidyl aminopeptidase/acylaminoacyl peptidase
MMQPILNPGMYKCAIGYVGVYDLPLMRKTDKNDGESDRIVRFWDRTLGTDMGALAKVSPALRAKEIDVPVMLVHGKADKTADFNQFKVMSAALREAGKPAEEFLANAEGHGFVKPENIAELYRRMEKFLDKYIGPSAQTAGTQ